MKKMLFPLCSALLLWGLSAQASKNTVSLNGKDYGIDTLVYKHNIEAGYEVCFLQCAGSTVDNPCDGD